MIPNEKSLGTILIQTFEWHITVFGGENFRGLVTSNVFAFSFSRIARKWSHTYKRAMCLHMCAHTCTLNIFDGAKYFSKAISISLQLSVKISCDQSSLCAHGDHVEVTRAKILRL